jgi:hypothetical protein
MGLKLRVFIAMPKAQGTISLKAERQQQRTREGMLYVKSNNSVPQEPRSSLLFE